MTVESPQDNALVWWRMSGRWPIIVLVSSALPVAAKLFGGSSWGFAWGVPVTLLAAFIVLRGGVYPRLYRRKYLAMIGLIVSGVFTYMSFSDLARDWIYRQTFQLTGPNRLFENAGDLWSLYIPVRWSHEEQKVGDVVNHIFKPSQPSPAMYLTLTYRADAGTDDLDTVVQNFFLNLPKGGEAQVSERGYVALPTGQRAYRAITTDTGRRIPLKSEILIVLEGPHLYVLTAGGHPRWFDYHRKRLEDMLNSLRVPRLAPRGAS
jgi:hypothetical protein